MKELIETPDLPKCKHCEHSFFRHLFRINETEYDVYPATPTGCLGTAILKEEKNCDCPGYEAENGG